MHSRCQKQSLSTLVAVLMAALFAAAAVAGGPAGTTITYQGLLKDGGSQVDGPTDLEFRLFDQETVGTQVGNTVILNDVPVSNGLVTVDLDFGVDPYTSAQPLWLEAVVEGQPLSRQQVTSSPFSLGTRGIDVDAAGNVGIGTGTPAEELDVAGNIRASGVMNVDTHYALGGDRILASDDVSSLSLGVGAGLSGNAGNTFIGYLSGQSTTALNNTFVGRQSAPVNTTGSGNAFFGTFTGFNSTGSNNTFIGASAGGPSTTGSNNTSLGFSAHIAAGGINNATAIGANTLATQSNTVVLGNGANVGIGTATPTEKLDVVGNIHASGTVSADAFSSNSPLQLQTAGTTRIFVDDTTGDVGIGTATPASELDVAGDIHATGTIASGNSIAIDGTSGNEKISSTANLEIELADGRVLRLETNAVSPIVIGGHSANSVTAGAVGAKIGGGGAASFPNRVTDEYGTIGGGLNNQAGDAAGGTVDKSFATVGGGITNRAAGDASTVAGGHNNTASGSISTVPGGSTNQAGGDYSFAAGRRAKVRDAAASGDSSGDEGTFIWADATNADFTSTGPNQFLIRASGGVGIGTTSPSCQLQVRAKPIDSGVFTQEQNAGALLVSATNNGGDSLAPPESALVLARGGIAGQAYANFARFDLSRYEVSSSNSRTQMDIRLSHGNLGTEGNGTPVIMTMRSNGNVGIGTTTPAFRLEVNGSAGKPGGGSWSVSSDIRLKKNIQPLHGALDTLLALHGVTFEYNDPEAINELPGERIGFVAQEVEQVMPDWVEQRADSYKALTIRGFEAMTVEAMRDLSNENAQLRTELNDLRSELAELKAAIKSVSVARTR